jgi:lipopolysaccharide export LptBFGC system permease protein LptF
VPRLLHRQIFLELFSVFVLCAGSLLTLLLIGRMLQLRELLLSQNLTFWDMLLHVRLSLAVLPAAAHSHPPACSRCS